MRVEMVRLSERPVIIRLQGRRLTITSNKEAMQRSKAIQLYGERKEMKLAVRWLRDFLRQSF